MTNATSIVTVRVLDVNDQMPTFDRSSYTGEVQENTQETIPVTLTDPISVTDFDEVPERLTCYQNLKFWMPFSMVTNSQYGNN